MRPCFGFLLVLTGLVSAFSVPLYAGNRKSAETFRECGLANLGGPAIQPVFRCAKSACVVSGEKKICKCLSKEGDRDVFLFFDRSKKVGSLPAEAYLGDVRDFEAWTGDWDADGIPEFIVANRDSVSNGLGVTSWTVTVLRFDPRWRVLDQAKVEDYGEGSFSRRPEEKECRLLETRWDFGNKASFRGRWLRLEDGRFKPIPGEREHGRRLSKDFEKEYVGSDEKKPLKWLLR